MKALGTTLLISALGCLFADATAQSYDLCKPIGWATRNGRTGGAASVTGGGNATPIVVTTFADLEKYARDELPRVIYIDGTLGGGWKGQSGDRLKITGSNKTIVGLKPGTRLNAVIRITEGAQNIILRNIVIQGPGSDTTQGWDNLNITSEAPDIVGPKNIWVDHCEFWDGQDGNADVVVGADNVTFTWCIFGYKTSGVHNLSNLIASGNSETISEGRLDITFMYNWWTGASQRQPRCRYGDIHVVNNLLSKNPDLPTASTNYGMAAGKDCKILAEANYFQGIQEPFSAQFKEGTSGLESVGNIFDGTTGNQTGWGTAFTPPYEYKSMMVEASKVKALVEKYAGANMPSPTTCKTTDVVAREGGSEVHGMRQHDNKLAFGDFEAGALDFAVYDLSGNLRHRQILSSSPREIDLSNLSLESGIYTALAKSERGGTASTMIHLVR